MSDELTALFERAEAHLSTQETKEAIPILEQIRRQYGDSARLSVNLGILAAYGGESQASFTHFSNALAQEPTNAQAAMNMASILVASGQEESAISVLSRVAQVARASGDAEKADHLMRVAERITQPAPQVDRLALLKDYADSGITEVGYERVEGDWLPWVYIDGYRFYNLPVAHFAELKQAEPLGNLLQLGWNQSRRDLKFRFECSSRYVPPHCNYPLKPGDTVVELGAYLGHFTMSMAQTVGPSGRVVAVEFIPENHRVLAHNLRHNFPDNTQAIHCGIWSEDGTRPAYRHMLQANSFTPHSLSGDYHEVMVPCRTIDTLLDECQVNEVDLMVVTINGSELEAFKGMTRSLERIKAFSVAARYGEGEENRTDSVARWFNERGFEVEIVGGDHVLATRPTD